MGQFNDLTPREEQVLLDVVQAARSGGATVFLLFSYRRQDTGESAGTLEAIDGEGRILGLPGHRAFYEQLHEKRYLYVTYTEKGSLHASIAKRALDYAEYMAKTPGQRRRADLVYDLGHDDTLRSKFIWAVLTVLISVSLSSIGTIIMILLGWIAAPWRAVQP